MRERKNEKQKKFINYMIIGVTLILIIWMVVEEYTDIKIEKGEERLTEQYQAQNLSTNYQQNEHKQQEEKTDELKTEEIKEYPKENIISQYRGYQVAAKLEIPDIELQTYILKKYSVDALNVSVTKFWGANPNEIGNFCVAGHNFQNKNMFRNLRKLEIGNRFFISDNIVGKIEYEIYDIYKVLPEDVSCLSQETKGKREVTLITCTNDSVKRIIVKARELEK